METQQQQRRLITLNDLPDELILKIFSFLPFYKETIASQLILQRWEDPNCDQLMMMTHVTIVDLDMKSIMSFIYGSLLSNYAQPLDRLHLKLSLQHSALDIDFLVRTAVERSLRKLSINLYGKTLILLPSCLSTCTTLKSLVLHDLTIKCVPCTFTLPSLKSLHLYSFKPTLYDSPSLLQACPVLEYLVLDRTYCDEVMCKEVSMSSLKSMHLYSVRFPGKEYVKCLLSNCMALEDLVINRTNDDNVMVFEIDVPTLRSLSIVSKGQRRRAYDDEIQGFMINAPSLRSLNFKDTSSNFLLFEYMPELTKAIIEINWEQSEKFLGSLISIQHLSLCALTSEIPYPRATFFFFLEHLELCTCSTRWANLLACILSEAPRLQSLKLDSRHSGRYNELMNLQTEPTVVPECLSNHLKILEWRQYEGTELESEVAAYILAYSTCLKMATFSSRFTDSYRDLKNMFRVSEMCQLVFE